MSFEKMETDELRHVARELFAVEVGENAQRKTVLKALKDDGITFDMYVDDRKAHGEWAEKDEERFFGSESAEEEDDDEPVTATSAVEVEEEVVLIKMVRANPSFATRGYRFTREHPFAPVKESDVDYFTEYLGGFVPATPKQIKEYYG